MEWRQVGPAAVLRMKRCQRLRATNKRDDIALISVFDKQANCDVFYAVQAWCPHAGGPLYHGDIEECGDKTLIACPWHGYEFDIKAGSSSFGLPIDTFEVKVENDLVFIKYKCPLSLHDNAC